MARWQLGAELCRETGDTDLGVPPVVVREEGVIGRLLERGYERIEGNGFARQIDDVPVTVRGTETPRSASQEHLRHHWMTPSRAAKERTGRPNSVQRIDAQNSSGGEVPQVHFRDGSALNIDGAWKHGERALNSEEKDWRPRRMGSTGRTVEVEPDRPSGYPTDLHQRGGRGGT